MYWKIFQVYKIKFLKKKKKKRPIPALLKALAQVLLNFTDSRPIPALLKALAQVLLNYTDSRPIPAFLKALEQVLPLSALSKALVQAFQKRWYRLSSHFHKGCPSAFKNAGIGILTLSQRFLGLSQHFSKRWDSPVFLQ